jgi:hypothetical protein
MSLATETQEALRVRQAEANDASKAFDLDWKVPGVTLATFWRQATPGTTYWRGYVPMSRLPGHVRVLENDSLDVEDGRLILKGQEGVAIWQFLGDDGRSRIAAQLRRQGVRTLMEVDDLYLNFAPPLYGKFGSWTRTHAEAVANGTGYSVEMHRKLVPQMDGIICSTEHLAERYAAYNPNVYLCPNSVIPDDWDVPRVESDVLRIGYYGSPSHVRDWPRVKKALKWAARQKDVEVSVIGFVPPGWTGKTVAWSDSVLDARKPLGAIDVGLAPLTRNVWADGKSDVKALEYAMAGVLPLLEDAPPYSPWKAIGWPLMAASEDEWVDLIKGVVANRDRVKEQAAAAKDYVLEHRTIDANIHRWKEAVDG